MTCTGYHIPHNIVGADGKHINAICADCGKTIPKHQGTLIEAAPGGFSEGVEAAAKVADGLADIARQNKGSDAPLSIDTNEAWRRVEDASLDIAEAIRALNRPQPGADAGEGSGDV